MLLNVFGFVGDHPDEGVELKDAHTQVDDVHWTPKETPQCWHKVCGTTERPKKCILEQLLSRERVDLSNRTRRTRRSKITSLKVGENIQPLTICCRFGGSSCLNLCSRFGESVMNLVCSGEQLRSCLSTGMGSDLGRNQKGTADMSVMVPAMR